MTIFNNTSADFVLISVENDHNFERTEDRATVFLKWMTLTISIIFEPLKLHTTVAMNELLCLKNAGA